MGPGKPGPILLNGIIDLLKGGTMAKVQINVSALNRFISRQVEPYLLKKAKEIADEARGRAPKATGELATSITVGRGTKKGSVVIKVDAPHAGFVHQGTGPQHQPSPRAPYYPKLRRRGLILWSESKAVNPYEVAHGISQKGTPPNPFLEESIAKVLGRFNFKWIRTQIEEQ